MIDICNNASIQEVEKLLRCSSTWEVIEFREFLHDCYNYENLTFWLDVEAYKCITSKELRTQKAFEIFLKYFGKGSEYELNIPDMVKTRLRQRLANPEVDSFDEAQRSIVHLMAEDSYPKFLASERYHKLRRELEIGDVEQRKPRQTKSYNDFAKFLSEREPDTGSSSVYPDVPIEPIRHVVQNSPPQPKKAISWTDAYLSLKNKRKAVVNNCEALNYRSMSVSFSGSSDDIAMKLLAGDIILNTRVQGNTLTETFIKKQLKKVPHDPTKLYGIYLVKSEKWLDESLPLIIYKSQLQNPKEIVALLCIDNVPNPRKILAPSGYRTSAPVILSNNNSTVQTTTTDVSKRSTLSV